MSKGKKAIKQHYNRILKDKERREKHFGASGALGSEKEGRERGRMLEISAHNLEAKEKLQEGNTKVVDKQLEALKRGKKITL